MPVGVGLLRMKAHIAPAAGLVAAFAIAVFACGMLAGMAGYDPVARIGGSTASSPAQARPRPPALAS